MEFPQINQVSAALIATLSAETSLPKGRIEQPLDRSQSRCAQDGILLVTNSSPTELASKAVAQDVWKHEDTQDDVAFVDGDWNENADVFEQKYPLDSVLALDADDAVADDEVVKEAEAAIVEGDVVDFPEVDVDRKDEGTLRDVVTEEVLVPAKGAPQTGWLVDSFPQGPAGCAL